jgi:hypothetical protein
VIETEALSQYEIDSALEAVAVKWWAPSAINRCFLIGYRRRSKACQTLKLMRKGLRNALCKRLRADGVKPITPGRTNRKPTIRYVDKRLQGSLAH